MIRKSGTGFPKRSCSNNKLKRDDDSKKNHPALVPAVEQRARDRIPFRVEPAVGDGLPGLPVPIGGVAGVAFETVQISMHPRGVAAVLVHDELVRLVPLALAGPPQGGQRRPTAARRRRRIQSSLEFIQCHGSAKVFGERSGTPTLSI